MKVRKIRLIKLFQVITLFLLIILITCFLLLNNKSNSDTQLAVVTKETSVPSLNLPTDIENIIFVYPGSRLVDISSATSGEIQAFEVVWHTNSDTNVVNSYLKKMYEKDHWRIDDDRINDKMIINKDNFVGVITVSRDSYTTKIKQVIFVNKK